MKSVRVSASREYDVIIGDGILCNAGDYIKSVVGDGVKLAVVTDDIVDGLYGESLSDALCGFETVKYVFKNGEESKNIRTYGEILEFLADNKITRTDVVVAFGGGVVGDMAGFAAATYLRGIQFIQIPTTLLAMVDSSVGGKTAIDLDGGKNLCGAFWQPSLVICDHTLLRTLSDEMFACGMAEVIKYAVLGDRELFDTLLDGDVRQDPEDVIARCVEMKRDIVDLDERDTGVRALLNFGHTAAHGIEKLSDYKIPHGTAVGMGMVIAARGAACIGMCAHEVVDEIITVLRLYGLPTDCPYSAEELFLGALSDKKRSGDSITLVLPKKTGKCVLEKMEISKVGAFFRAGLGNTQI